MSTVSKSSSSGITSTKEPTTRVPNLYRSNLQYDVALYFEYYLWRDPGSLGLVSQEWECTGFVGNETLSFRLPSKRTPIPRIPETTHPSIGHTSVGFDI